MAKFKFIILEQNGNVEIQEREYSDGKEAMAHVSRFVSLFKNDPYQRIARVTVDGRVMVNYDSINGHTSYTRPRKA